MRSVTLYVLSLIFVILSFSPSLYEIYRSNKIPPERTFTLEHNYLFDYNFYLSRIREGIEGNWLVVEKYYNREHNGSLFQILYLGLGKIGGIIRLSPPIIYHLSRIVFGFIFLVAAGRYFLKLFRGRWSIVAFLFAVTAGSWPILIKIGENYRFATYMGWWSAVDSLQRIAFIPHVLFGQIFLLLFVWYYGRDSTAATEVGHDFFAHLPNSPSRPAHRDSWHSRTVGVLKKHGLPAAAGLIVGIVFPPTLIVVYAVFGVLSVLEFSLAKSDLARLEWFKKQILPRLLFILLSFPSLIYLKKMFQILPWSALALFDIQHRMPLPYREYALALGPVLPLGLLGMILAFIKKEKKLFPSIAWVLAVVILIVVFERIPEQSPLRWTEAAVHVPLGILTTYLFLFLWEQCNKYKLSLAFVSRWGIRIVIAVIILMGLGVMGSMVLWLTDQARWKSEGTWAVPIGAQLVYPLKDFMDGVYYLRDNTKRGEVVLTYVTAGNFIPSYAGNFVFIGHANTPDEDTKEKIAAEFFSGKMKAEEAKEFLRRENISYIYFGPQEKEIGGVKNLAAIYPFITAVYNNNQVVIYKF